MSLDTRSTKTVRVHGSGPERHLPGRSRCRPPPTTATSAGRASTPWRRRADTGTTPATSASPVSAPCPQCGTPRSGRDRFCESCGFDFAREAAADAAPADGPGWAATVGPDRDQYARVAPDGLTFPDREAPRTIVLDAGRFRIGRRRTERRRHARDRAQRPGGVAPARDALRIEDGDWAIVDEGSANGTTINADPDPIPPTPRSPCATATASTSARGRRSRWPPAEPQKSCGCRIPSRRTSAARRARFSFCGSSPTPNRSNSTRRWALTASTLR